VSAASRVEACKAVYDMTNLLPRPRAFGDWQAEVWLAAVSQTSLRGHAEAKESPRGSALGNIGICFSASRIACDGHA
jgi:hypothetical protein